MQNSFESLITKEVGVIKYNLLVLWLVIFLWSYFICAGQPKLYSFINSMTVSKLRRYSSVQLIPIIIEPPDKQELMCL